MNQGLSVEQVAGRVNASPRIIRDHYDAAKELEAFEERRQAASQALSIDTQPPADDTEINE